MKRVLTLVLVIIFFFSLFTPAFVFSAGCNQACRDSSECTDSQCPDCRLVTGKRFQTCQSASVQPPSGVGCGTACRDSSECTDPSCPECDFPYPGARFQTCNAPTQEPLDEPSDGETEEGGPIHTAIGDIDPTNLQGFIQQLLNLALGVAGGIAFLLMLFGAFQIMTSSGNPEKMKAGGELITSALTGLLFIIFSIFLLKLIGVDILQIPGFGQ